MNKVIDWIDCGVLITIVGHCSITTHQKTVVCPAAGWRSHEATYFM